MSGVSRIAALLRSLTSFSEALQFDAKIEVSLFNEFKDDVTNLISIALNDVNRRKEVAMCSGLLFDEKTVRMDIG